MNNFPFFNENTITTNLLIKKFLLNRSICEGFIKELFMIRFLMKRNFLPVSLFLALKKIYFYIFSFSVSVYYKPELVRNRSLIFISKISTNY